VHKSKARDCYFEVVDAKSLPRGELYADIYGEGRNIGQRGEGVDAKSS